MINLSPPVIAAEALDDAAAYLRLSSDEDLTLLAGLLVTSLLACEAFCGQILLRRTGSETLTIAGIWQMLTSAPLRSITALTGLTRSGEAVPIAAEGYAIDIDECGGGWVRIHGGGGDAVRARVSFEAGLADSWNDIAAPLRQGMLRLAAHLYANRDAAVDAGPPAAVAALWLGYRRLRLSSRSVA